MKLESDNLTKEKLAKVLIELYDSHGMHPEEVFKRFAFYECAKCKNILVIKR